MTDATTSRTSVRLVCGVAPDAASFSCLLTSAPDAVEVIVHDCAYPVIPTRGRLRYQPPQAEHRHAGELAATTGLTPPSPTPVAARMRNCRPNARYQIRENS